MRCSRCQADNSDGARFCHQCGDTLAAGPAAPTFCPHCGQPATPGASFCGSCGQSLAASPAHQYPQALAYPSYPASASSEYSGERYAGFWIRFAAYLIDSLIVTAFSFLLYSVAFAIRIATSSEDAFGVRSSPGWTAALYLFAWLGGIIGGWLYFAKLESGPKQATFGKRAVGVYVTDDQGQPLSFGRASGRHFAKILSSLTFWIGFMLAGWTERKQALHDFIASTTVRRR